jgi:hypothetical protein
MQLVLSFVRYLCIFFLGIIVALFASAPFEALYRTLYPSVYSGPFDINLAGIGISIATATLAISFLLIIFGDRNRYVAFAIFVLLQGLFSIYNPSDGSLNTATLFTAASPFVIALIGGLIGILLRFIFAKTFGGMPQFAQYKKYF